MPRRSEFKGEQKEYRQMQDDQLQDEKLSPELIALFASYRQALPDREADPQFMPGVWARIEARRKDAWWFGRIARGFVTAAGAICLLIMGAIWLPEHSTASLYTTTYVDVVAEDSGPDDALETL